jgi:hypothetical protein
MEQRAFLASAEWSNALKYGSSNSISNATKAALSEWVNFCGNQDHCE